MYKILIYDAYCQRLLSHLIHVKKLHKYNVTLYFLLDKDRNPIPDIPALHSVRPTPANVRHIIFDASRSLYDCFHLNFSSSVPHPLLEDLATGALSSNSIHRISKVYDQYLKFITIEDSLFSLGMRDRYVQLNDPAVGDAKIEWIINEVMMGLFFMLVTLGVVSIISCPCGGPAEMVAVALDQKMRDHLLTKNNLFVESGGGDAGIKIFLC